MRKGDFRFSIFDFRFSKGSKYISVLVLAAFLFALPSRTSAQGGDTIAIKAGKVITITGPAIENGVVLVRGGKIVSVGKTIEIPSGAKVLEAAVVMPGLVEAHSSRGMDSPNENVPVVPFVTTADGIDPLHFSFEDALREGITSIHVIEGNATVVGGTGIVVKPVGGTVEAIMIKRPTAMKLSLSPGGGRNRIAQISELRKAFEDYELYVSQLSDRRAEQKKAGQPEEEFDPKQLAMREMVEGRLPVFIFCPKDADVTRAIEIIETRNTKDATWIEALQYPLDRNDRPVHGAVSEGRFLIRHEGFLDPAVYVPRREVTVAGEVQGRRTQTLDEAEYAYPVVADQEVRLWGPRKEPVFHFGLGFGVTFSR